MVHLDGGGQAAELCICLRVCTVVPITFLKEWDTSSCALCGVWHLEHTASCVNVPRSKKGGRGWWACCFSQDSWAASGSAGSWVCECFVPSQPCRSRQQIPCTNADPEMSLSIELERNVWLWGYNFDGQASLSGFCGHHTGVMGARQDVRPSSQKPGTVWSLGPHHSQPNVFMKGLLGPTSATTSWTLGNYGCLSIHTLDKALSYRLTSGWESLDQASVTGNLILMKCVSW